jgi:hypothetical protein
MKQRCNNFLISIVLNFSKFCSKLDNYQACQITNNSAIKIQMATTTEQEDFLFTVQHHISSNDLENIMRDQIALVSQHNHALHHTVKDSIDINIQYSPQNYFRNFTNPNNCNSLFPFLEGYHFTHTHTHT